MASTDTDSTPARRHAVVLAIASLTWAAAVIHAVVVPDHLREWGPAGAFFIAAAALQLIWSAVILRHPTRRWLLLGAAGNGALVIVWLISRTSGIPIGPQAGTPEALGALDALASLNEVFAVGLVAVLLSGRTLPLRAALGSGTALAAASVLAALTVSPHAHGSSHGHSQPRTEAGAQRHSGAAAPRSTPERPARRQAPSHGATHPHHTSAHSH